MSEPVFEFSGSNPFGMSSLSNLADIDHDGDLDAFAAGTGNSTLFYRNTGTASNPVFAAPQTNPFGLTNAGEKNAFVDIDNDGDLDVFAGDFSGNTRFFKNTGTATNPAFAATVNNPFGLANVGTPRCVQRGVKLHNFEN